MQKRYKNYENIIFYTEFSEDIIYVVQQKEDFWWFSKFHFFLIIFCIVVKVLNIKNRSSYCMSYELASIILPVPN